MDSCKPVTTEPVHPREHTRLQQHLLSPSPLIFALLNSYISRSSKRFGVSKLNHDPSLGTYPFKIFNPLCVTRPNPIMKPEARTGAPVFLIHYACSEARIHPPTTELPEGSKRRWFHINHRTPNKSRISFFNFDTFFGRDTHSSHTRLNKGTQNQAFWTDKSCV